MWEMQQLVRREGALDVDLMSNQPEERRCDRLLLRGCIRENMENVRGPRRMGCPDLTAFHWGCEGGKPVSVGVWDLL